MTFWNLFHTQFELGPDLPTHPLHPAKDATNFKLNHFLFSKSQVLLQPDFAKWTCISKESEWNKAERSKPGLDPHWRILAWLHAKKSLPKDESGHYYFV